jgi:hypothetical protein
MARLLDGAAFSERNHRRVRALKLASRITRRLILVMGRGWPDVEARQSRIARIVRRLDQSLAMVWRFESEARR